MCDLRFEYAKNDSVKIFAAKRLGVCFISDRFKSLTASRIWIFIYLCMLNGCREVSKLTSSKGNLSDAWIYSIL